MSYYKMPILEETGYAVLDSYGGAIDPSEWMSLEYVDWKSSGDTRFAPIASAQGEIGCNAFWHSEPPRCDKDGIWIDSQVAKAPTLVERVKEVDARVGRCRVIVRGVASRTHRAAKRTGLAQHDPDRLTAPERHQHGLAGLEVTEDRRHGVGPRPRPGTTGRIHRHQDEARRIVGWGRLEQHRPRPSAR